MRSLAGKKSSGRYLKGRASSSASSCAFIDLLYQALCFGHGLRCLVSASRTVLEVGGLSSLGFTGELGARGKCGNLLCIVGI